jgi:hypothetical protein
MADRTSKIVTLPAAPLVEENTEVPNVVESGATVEVTVVTVKSGGGIQTVTTTP